MQHTHLMFSPTKGLIDMGDYRNKYSWDFDSIKNLTADLDKVYIFNIDEFHEAEIEAPFHEDDIEDDLNYLVGAAREYYEFDCELIREGFRHWNTINQAHIGI